MPCTTILVGKKASCDGSTIIARNDDGTYETKRVVVTEPEKQPRVYKSVIGHLTVELPEQPLRYTSVPNVSRESGLWPTCGINAANVAMTATETVTSNPRVLGADPLVRYRPAKGRKQKAIPGGIGEEDILALVLPYIRTAREGVLRMGSLLERYGTYESNGMAFSDVDEVWWLETIGGHHWIAKRVPDDRVVIMPNQFGLDEFDFEDALGEGRENLCSRDLKEFTERYHLYRGSWERFDPRLAYGSRSDSDHIYNTPRAWYMARYFLPTSYRWDGEGADFTPISDDIPWSFVPEHRVSVEDVRYILGSYYQGTPYDPYDASSPLRGRYRCIGVPNSDVCGILQLRGDMPEPLRGVEWLSLGGSGFTACFPVYAAVSRFPDYIGRTPDTYSSEYLYWASRTVSALTDADYRKAILFSERYVNAVANEGRRLLNEADARYAETQDPEVLEKANEEILAMVRRETDKVLAVLLTNANDHMRLRYHRGDN